MANQVGTATPLRARKNVVREDLYTRYEIASVGDNVKGEIFIRKGVTWDPAETVTITRSA